MLVGDLNINSKELPFRLTLNSHLASYKVGSKIKATNGNGIYDPLNEEYSQR